MGTCTVKISEPYDEKSSCQKKNDPFSTTWTNDFSSIPITWRVVPAHQGPDLTETWLTRKETPMSDSTNNMNQPEVEIVFVYNDKLTKPKSKAYLISLNQIEGIVEKIYWTKQWGYIIFDSKANPMIHGKSAESLGIKLSKICEDERTDNLRVGETEYGDLVIMSSFCKKTIKVFRRRDIETTIQSGLKFLRSADNYFGDFTVGFDFYRTKHHCQPYNKERNLSMGLSNTGVEFFCQQGNDSCYKQCIEISGNPDETNGCDGSDKSEKLFSGYKKCKTIGIRSICVVQKMDHWEIMCGHDSGTYTLWRMKLENLHLPAYVLAEKIENSKEYIWAK